ncbi:MAG: GNAT family N-acetyltransferase [Acidobacteriota bacterium]|nr:GNAT family N-acetyltransferase [Acidobacteriota bacterium]MDH3529108.1 GNAT family N-acetyltransferase [Acidobacteriota bacterium]
MVNIKPATVDEVSEIHALIRDSITLLCSSDHNDEPHNLDFWLGNRTPEYLEDLISDKNSKGFLCLTDSSIVGVAHIKRDGELTLCYVHPEHPGKGIGSKLLNMIESQARHWELEEIHLISTATAKSFYEHHGYIYSGETVSYLRMPGYPLKKQLISQNA